VGAGTSLTSSGVLGAVSTAALFWGAEDMVALSGGQCSCVDGGGNVGGKLQYVLKCAGSARSHSLLYPLGLQPSLSDSQLHYARTAMDISLRSIVRRIDC